MTSKRRPDPERPGAPLERAWTIPAAWYVDPDHHRDEIERVIGRTWQHAARADEVAAEGEWVTADLAGEPILVVRGRDGALRAFHNVCRHRAGAVAVGERGCSKALRCMYHGWSYGLDGALLAAPEMEGVRDFRREEFGLVPVRCDAWGPLVLVNLDPKAGPMAEALGALPALAARTAFAGMEFARRDVYDIACNWKVYVDNYLEGYHVPAAHPALNRVLDYRRYTVTTDGPLVIQESPDRRGGGTSGEGYLYVWAYPNLMLNVSPDYAQINVILPAGPERTRCVFDYYFAPGRGKASAAARERSVAWSDAIQKEDIVICETVQRNLRSRAYRAGRYSAKRENGLHHFHELLRRDLSRPARARRG